MGCYEFGAPPHVGNDENSISPRLTRIENYPNPVYLDNNRGNVFLEFTLPKIPVSDPVINIYNAKGQKVKQIDLTQSLSGLARIAGLATTDTQNGEAYSTVWDCRNERGKTVSSGVYFYVLSVNDEVVGANKLLLFK
jgi:flagellar hook assembly protein FlgD